MLKVASTSAGGKTVLTFSGSIDEDDDLAKLAGVPTGPCVYDCGGVLRINSVGVKAWMKYFSALGPGQGEIHNLSLALVEQLNLIKNFMCRATLVSVQIPYRCGACQGKFEVSNAIAGLKGKNLETETTPCPKCGKASTIDDDVETYFHFLNR